MLTLESLNADKTLYVFLTVQFAERVLPIWEAEYPKDMRPREAIEAAKAWLSNPSEGVAPAAHAANAACADAACADAASYAAAAYYAASAAASAASAASNAAYAAHAADAAFYAAAHAAAHAANAADALRVDEESLIHEVMLENLDWILHYKIENGKSFAEPELILDYLSEEQRQSFLFNLEVLR